MNQFEFLDYTPTPNDKYGMIGFCTVRLYGKVILKYKKVKQKNGSGEFFASPSYSIDNGNGEDKKYVNTHFLDSRADEEMLMNFMRDKVHEFEMKSAASKSQVKSDIPFIQRPEYQQTVMGVADDNQPPF